MKPFKRSRQARYPISPDSRHHPDLLHSRKPGGRIPALFVAAGLMFLVSSETTFGQAAEPPEETAPIDAAAPAGNIAEPPATVSDEDARHTPSRSDAEGDSASNAEVPLGNGDEIRLNFRGAPLDMVLDYLSRAAGFVILLETEVQGRVDLWSHHSVSRDEAVELLNTVLNKNGYAAVRNGRTLKIVNRDEAKTQDIPVRSGSDPNQIPKSDEIVTQVVPVRYANATQLIRDLQPLLPTYATLSANESSNAVVITDTQSNIHRMVQIIRALDTSISSISAIRVFALRYADAKELATVVKEIFEIPDTSRRNNNDRRAEFFSRMRGGPGGDGGGGAPTTTGQSEARNAASRVVAVADERTNSLVVSAPDELVPLIETVVTEIDTQVEDITELRVFPLAYSDPVEMAEVLMELFPDETSRNQGRTGGPPQFGRFGGRGGNNNAEQSSERMRKMGRVLAVPDPRTASVIVTASSEMMVQIAQMIEQLDSNPAKKQKVFVFQLDHADPQNTAEILRDMFENRTSGTTRRNTGAQNTNPLNNRNTTGAGFGTGFGTGTGSGLGGGNNTRGGNTRR